MNSMHCDRVAQPGKMLALLLLALAVVCGCNKEPAGTVQPSTPAVTPSVAPETPHWGWSNLDRIKTKGVLRIGVKGDSPPFCFQDKDGVPRGFDVDLGYRLARSMGVEPQFITVSGPERIERLKHGDVDILIATLTATRKRAHDIDFSIPYFQDHQELLVKTSAPIQSYRDLAHRSVAAVSNSTSIDNLKTVAPDCTVMPVKTYAEGFEKLKSGEVDAMTSDGLTLQALRLEAATPADFRIAGEGFSVEPYVIGLPQNDSTFRNRIDEALTELWNSGVWTRLFNKWLGPESPYNMEPHFQMPVLPP